MPPALGWQWQQRNALFRRVPLSVFKLNDRTLADPVALSLLFALVSGDESGVKSCGTQLARIPPDRMRLN